MKNYKKENLTIHWESSKCTHSGFCARQLSSVFKPKDRPWIQPEGADKETIMKQIEKCPSKALSYTLD